MKNLKIVGAVVGGVFAATTFALPSSAADVTQSRMENADAEPHNWIMHHKNYFGHRYMTITQIKKTTSKT